MTINVARNLRRSKVFFEENFGVCFLRVSSAILSFGIFSDTILVNVHLKQGILSAFFYAALPRTWAEFNFGLVWH